LEDEILFIRERSGFHIFGVKGSGLGADVVNEGVDLMGAGVGVASTAHLPVFGNGFEREVELDAALFSTGSAGQGPR